MITNCNTCGNYTVRIGKEIAGARTMIAKIRLDKSGHSQIASIRQLKLEVDLLLASLRSDDTIPTADNNPRALSVVA